MIIDPNNLKEFYNNSNPNDEVKEAADFFLKSFENEHKFNIELKRKGDNCDIQISLQEGLWHDIFGERKKHPFSLLIGKNSMTFYFRINHEYFNNKKVKLGIKRSKTIKKNGESYLRLYNIEDTKKLIDYVFNQKLGLNLTTHSHPISAETDNLYELMDELDLSKENKKRLSSYRDGQQKFRDELLKKWGYQCAVTGLYHPNILKASHIKPYRDCNKNEAYDVDNGILLSPNIDTLFDQFLISFENDGSIILGNSFTTEEYLTLGVSKKMKLNIVTEGMKKYLKEHQEKCI